MHRDHLTTFEIDSRLRQVAMPRLGLVTADAAARVGVDRWALARRREAGALEYVFAQVMRLTSVPASADQRVLAAALAVPKSTIIATSAAALHGMPVHAGIHVPVISIAASRSARTVGIRIVRQRLELPSRPWHAVWLATPAAALLLLPRFVDAATVERCFDHSLVHRFVSARQLSTMLATLPPSAVAGRQLLLDLVEQRSVGVGHRSRVEQRVAQWLNLAGVRGWQRNYRVQTSVGTAVEVDFAWPSAKLALEVSPYFTHGTRATQERDVERRRLLTQSGWRTVEATDPDLASRSAFGETIRALQLLLPIMRVPQQRAS